MKFINFLDLIIISFALSINSHFLQWHSVFILSPLSHPSENISIKTTYNRIMSVNFLQNLHQYFFLVVLIDLVVFSFVNKLYNINFKNIHK